MITKVRKGNKIIRVTENELGKYLATGYHIVEKKVSVPQEEVAHEPETIVETKPKKTTARRKKSTDSK